METQIWSSCRNRFILAEKITILSVSSDDILHDIFKVSEQQMWNYSSYVKKKLDSQARAVGLLCNLITCQESRNRWDFLNNLRS